MDDILTKLAAPFPPEAVSWRVGSTNKEKTKGMALAYIDSRDVQDRLNEVCGLDWQVRHPWAEGSKLACEIGIKIDGEWIWRGDGAGDSDVEAEKGAFSDSFKRAAVRWGVGRYLYDLDSPWIAIEPFGRSYKIADSERAKLRALLNKNAKAEPTRQTQPATQRPTASAAPPASHPHKPAPGKYELLSATGDVVKAFDKPMDWYNAVREALMEKGAKVVAIWENNKDVARNIENSNPELRWRVQGNDYHPIEVLERMVEKLAPGIAA